MSEAHGPMQMPPDTSLHRIKSEFEHYQIWICIWIKYTYSIRCCAVAAEFTSKRASHRYSVGIWHDVTLVLAFNADERQSTSRWLWMEVFFVDERLERAYLSKSSVKAATALSLVGCLWTSEQEAAGTICFLPKTPVRHCGNVNRYHRIWWRVLGGRCSSIRHSKMEIVEMLPSTFLHALDIQRRTWFTVVGNITNQIS